MVSIVLVHLMLVTTNLDQQFTCEIWCLRLFKASYGFHVIVVTLLVASVLEKNCKTYGEEDLSEENLQVRVFSPFTLAMRIVVSTIVVLLFQLTVFLVVWILELFFYMCFHSATISFDFCDVVSSSPPINSWMND